MSANTLPENVQRHLYALGVGDAGQDTIVHEMNKALLMTRDQLVAAIELKGEAVRLLRIQQSVYLTVLEDRSYVR